MTPPLKPIPDDLDGYLPGSAGALAVVLASQIGYREGYNNDNAYGVWYPMNNVPWCAIFISWGAWHASIDQTVIPKHAWTPGGEAWFRERHRLYSSPQVGDIGYVYYESLGRVGHVFFVERVWHSDSGATLMDTIEGNTNDTGSSQGNGVYRGLRADTTNLSYGRPAYAVPSEPPGDDELSAQAEAQISEILGILKSTVAPGQVSFESTVEATLGTTQHAINEIRGVLAEVESSERLLVLGVEAEPERYLVWNGTLKQIPTEVMRVDLANSEAIRVVYIDPGTLAWLNTL